MRAPPGYEAYNIDWSKLTPAMVAVICAFADALREIRENEIALLRLSVVDRLKLMCDTMRELNVEMRAERLFHDP